MSKPVEEIPPSLAVPLSSLVEIAIECWRLERWLAVAHREGSAPHVRHVARRLAKFLGERELATLDITGRRYEPGLAVEVLDATDDEQLSEGTTIIDEMVAPIVLWRGTVVRHGQVIVRRKA
ncbi:MAG TPA: hypothetical protein VM934_13795 [Pyrinomonadaceae bacterium]|jgi:hypothetical protein|nr:hypothetical protein [Pyrinomonadaceae bacterium]